MRIRTARSKKLATVENGQLTLGFEEAKSGDRNFACGEIQTKGRYRYGTYEARMKAATGSGLNSAFFTYIGPTDKSPMMKSTSRFWARIRARYS